MYFLGIFGLEKIFVANALSRMQGFVRIFVILLILSLSRNIIFKRRREISSLKSSLKSLFFQYRIRFKPVPNPSIIMTSIEKCRLKSIFTTYKWPNGSPWRPCCANGGWSNSTQTPMIWLMNCPHQHSRRPPINYE